MWYPPDAPHAGRCPRVDDHVPGRPVDESADDMQEMQRAGEIVLEAAPTEGESHSCIPRAAKGEGWSEAPEGRARRISSEGERETTPLPCSRRRFSCRQRRHPGFEN